MYCDGRCQYLNERKHKCELTGEKLAYMKQTGSISFSVHEHIGVCKGKRWNVMENRHLYRAKRIDNGEWVEWNMITGIPHDVHILDNTICQCTGLKDKNGKLIFENDILSGHIDVEFPEDETRKRVVWHENGWCTNEPGCDDYEELDDFDSENFEVIGNMIDNPELLEV